jgi:predicted kinase
VQSSGKSTWASANARRLEAVILSSDEIRNELEANGRPEAAQNGHQVFAIFYERLARLLNEGRNVISDATHARQTWRNDDVTIARSLGARLVGVWFDVPHEICRARNARRPRTGLWGERHVPEDLLGRVAREFEPPEPAEFDEVWRVRP